jgi:hypothetical protein
LIAGDIKPEILKQWQLKVEIALPQIARVLGTDNAARDYGRKFIDYLCRPDTLTYSNVFTVTGQKPNDRAVE